jgi:hypothetical protein
MLVLIMILNRIPGYVITDMSLVIHRFLKSTLSIQVAHATLIKSINMKKIIVIISVFLGISFSVKAQSQAEIVAGRVADKMKDSLSLNSSQRTAIYTVNLQLANSKSEVRRNFQQMDSVRIYMQRVENTRDSLYKGVLNEQQFLFYKKRKMTLLN